MFLKSIGKYFLLLTWILVSVSCKKDNANSPSRTELLTSAPWILTALTTHQGAEGGDGVDKYADMDACSKDNLTIFKTDGAGIYDQGPDKCDGSLQTINFSWSFYNPFTGTIDENVIKFQNFGFDALAIVELTSTTLKVKYFFGGGFHMYTYSH